jgi:hypothetical protein
MGLGKSRGFRLVRQLNVPHGRQHNDTLVTVEVKVNSSLDEWNENENDEEKAAVEMSHFVSKKL